MNLNEINERLRRTNIKGKEYVEVNQRVLAFRELYPNGSIVTQLLEDTGTRCTFKATVYDGDMPMSTGHAFEFQGSGMVNKTSYLENCETSAVGRALGFLGIGITEALCSADEVAAAIAHQERGEQPKDASAELDAAQKRMTAIVKKRAELDGVTAAEWYEKNIRSRKGYVNDAETLNMICDELEES